MLRTGFEKSKVYIDPFLRKSLIFSYGCVTSVYKIHLSSNDGAEGEVNLVSELYGEIFKPLQDKTVFKSFTLEGHTLSWSNSADFAPEFLREILPNMTLQRTVMAHSTISSIQPKRYPWKK